MKKLLYGVLGVLAIVGIAQAAQNLRQMEADLRSYVPQVLDLPEDKAAIRCEMAVRNYDPCISCSTHFLKVKIERE